MWCGLWWWCGGGGLAVLRAHFSLCYIGSLHPHGRTLYGRVDVATDYCVARSLYLAKLIVDRNRY